MLTDEISSAQRAVRTDAYQMSVGELVNLYDERELLIDPEFQRLFRWNIGQKSKLIESLLLGIPLPPIFVFEKENGKWELIDGLQRISTLLEFMGKLRSPDDALMPPSFLEATRYLSSLRNVVWERSDRILEIPLHDQKPLDKSLQLAIRRARLGVEILKRPSDDQTKYDLFQRLNAGGTEANPQELRNCIMLMVGPMFFRSVKRAANTPEFQTVTAVTEDQLERQRHMEYASRFLVHTLVPYDGKLDVEEYVDEGIVHLAGTEQPPAAEDLITRTFSLLNSIDGKDTLKRFEDGVHVGKVGLVGLEGIAVGVAKNLNSIMALPNPHEFIANRIHDFWRQPETITFSSPGLRGTTRIQRTVPFGERWFHP
jgi:hypothetical protein